MTPPDDDARPSALELACLNRQLRRAGAAPLPAAAEDAAAALALDAILAAPGLEAVYRRAALEPPPHFAGGARERRRRLALWLIARLPALDGAQLAALESPFGALAEAACRLTPADDSGPLELPLSLRSNGVRVELAELPDPEPDAAPVAPRVEWSAFGVFSPEAAAAYGAAPDADGRRDAVLHLAGDLVTQAKGAARPAAEALDAALAALRAAAAADDATLVPGFWTYSGEWDESRLADGPPCETSLKFSDREPVGRLLGVERFSWGRGDGSPGRPGRVGVSVGPKVPWVYACYNAAKAANLPALDPMLARISTWLKHLLRGTFDDELKDFYLAAHDDLGAPWRAADEAGFERFRDHLHEALAERRGYAPFSPSRRDEYPWNWVVTVGAAASETGRVRRVVRPGLQDAQGRLICPAVVEVD